MNEEQAKQLLERYRKGLCSDEEQIAVEAWIEQELSEHSWNITHEDKLHFGQSLKDRIDLRRHSSDETGLQEQIRVSRFKIWLPRIAAAASILLFLSVGGYFIWHKQPQQQTAQNQINDIAPGSNKAVLTLANGKQIILTGAKNGKLANESNTAINKTANGQVTYVGLSNNSAAIAYNTMTTPRGGQYTLTLSDGTKVILNAASSLRYPASFTGNDRKVELTGEAYFEVAHNAAKPFKVTSNGQTVEVLGTHFNINSYTDEQIIKTTLLEGSVKVTQNASGISKMLKPGQQSLLSGGRLAVADANIEEAVAWKNGYFRFNDENIESIMRKLSRWYNIDVQYEGRTSDEGFYGKISRFKNISGVLKMLEQTKSVHFKVEGRRVTVLQ
ncbi:FecR family protein [Mucilaginibacter sp. L196]|uniref:FecR family protein n=1 Tax=Mucilaginibacter sp. L196 TaxID=1641870 RepID=UPI00131CFA0B|nr:FecR family protein [Mucilaginibacter sp. L196]